MPTASVCRVLLSTPTEDSELPSDVNTVVLIGRLTRDPELRSTPGGLSICKLGLAVNERFKSGGSGEWEERANFFDITVFGAQADSCAKYLGKGRAIAIQGRLRFEQWEKDGQKRSKVGVVANSVQFLSDGKSSSESGNSSGSSSGFRMADDEQFAAAASAARADVDEDIPF